MLTYPQVITINTLFLLFLVILKIINTLNLTLNNEDLRLKI